MDIKPWYIIIVGIVAQIIAEIVSPSEYVLHSIINFPETHLSLASIPSLFLELIVLSSLFILPLFYEKTRKLGAFLCIFFGISSPFNFTIISIFIVFAGFFP